jgi:Plant mobile domain.
MAIPHTAEFLSYLRAREVLMDPILRWNLGRLRFLFLWRHQVVDWNMILGAVSFWSPSDHVFRFGLDEICPTVEEFSSLMGLDPFMPTALPFSEVAVRSILISFLGLSPTQARIMKATGLIDLRILVEHASILPLPSYQRQRDLVAVFMFIRPKIFW